MINVIKSEFSRLWKAPAFFVSAILVSVLAIVGIAIEYLPKIWAPRLYENYTYDSALFNGSFYAIMIISAFTSAFLGTEFSDGTIRNKLIAGHSHAAIYLGKFLVCSAASVILNVLGFIVRLALGNILFETTNMSVTTMLSFTLFGSLFLIALNSIYMVIPMFMQSKSSGIIVTMSTGFALIMAVVIISLKRMNPDHYAIYDYLYDILPTCQIYRIFIQSNTNMPIMSLYAVIITVAFTALGIFSFKKRDMK